MVSKRKFNDKIFILYGTYYTDISIPNIKLNLQKQGYYVRVIQDQMGNSLVYRRKKKIKRKK